MSHPAVVDVNQRIYREVEALGHEVVLVVPARWRHEYAPGVIRPRRLDGFEGTIIELPIGFAGSVPLHFYRRQARPLVESVAPDVVYLEEEPYSVAALQWALAAAAIGVPACFYTAQNIQRRYPAPVRWLEAAVWKRCASATAVSAEAADALHARGYRGQVSVLPLSVDVDAFAPAGPDMELRTRLGLRPRVIAYLGRLTTEKGVGVLLDAHRRLSGSTDASLLLVGGGPLADTCRQTVGVVVVEGVAHRDVPAYLRLADVLAMPSLTTATWKEQFGRVAIEALACGVPVVGSDSGNIPNLLAQTGGGVVVPEGDSAALAGALQSLLRDDTARSELGATGRAGVLRHYSSSAAALGLVAILKAVPRAVPGGPRA